MLEYKLLTENSSLDLTKSVNKHINDGYELYGNPSIDAVQIAENHIASLFAQAVIKKDKATA